MIKVVIDQTDIKMGKRGQHQSCPVVHALKKVFRSNNIMVYSYYAFVGSCYITFPIHIEKFINDYDAGRYVTSTSFEIPDPPEDIQTRKPK